MSFGQFPPIIGEVPNVFKDKMPTFVIGSVYLFIYYYLLFIYIFYASVICNQTTLHLDVEV